MTHIINIIRARYIFGMKMLLYERIFVSNANVQMLIVFFSINYVKH